MLSTPRFADKSALQGDYADVSRDVFLNSMLISAFSFTEIAHAARPMMTNGGVTLTYLGAQRITPNYNVMGVAKAALEASVRYLAVDLGGENIRVNAISPWSRRLPGQRSAARGMSSATVRPMLPSAATPI